MASSKPEIIIFHYAFSLWARKVHWYLQLRGIPHKQCMQASVLPRPDLLALGITYRRIPVVAFDNAIYVDTALQLDDLEARFPLKAGERGEGGSLVGCDRADVVRWRQWSRGLTIYAVGCLPSDLPALNDETMIKDRADLTGSTRFSPEILARNRGASLEGLEKGFREVEEVLQDGRPWITGERLTLADIDAIWPLHWINTIPGALKDSPITASNYPKTFAWIERFNAALPPADDSNVISGAEAKEIILSKWTGRVGKAEAKVDGSEGGWSFDDEVEVLPVDTGRLHPQKGRLRGLTKETVTLEVVPPGEEEGGRALLFVAPRTGYEIRAPSTNTGSQL